MVPKLLSFHQELKKVEVQVRREINLKAARFEDLIKYSPDQLDDNTCPAIVIAVGKACGYREQHTLNLAAIIQFIYMADQVHRLMTDDENLPEEHRQFPVLVGDFLYGKFFLELCRGQILNFLNPLAEVISTMSQGAIARWLAQGRELHKEDWLKILEQERASLTGMAARLSAQLAGASLHIQEITERFGWELGMAWATCRQHLGMQHVEETLVKAREIIAELPASVEAKPLQELVEYMNMRLCAEAALEN